LKAGELLRDASPEGRALAPWFIAHGLVLHGKLAVQQGNAVLADGLFNAAIEQAENQLSGARKRLLMFRCKRAKGDLLLKWDKREREGADILEHLEKFDLSEAADASEFFVPPPSLQEIHDILNID
jgi:hypothetical protein